MQILRNVFYRRGRAFLTIFGISIGVFALVVLGALSEKITLLVDGGISYYRGKVIVSDGGTVGGYGTTPISTNKVADIEKVEGVKRASAELSMLLADEMASVSMGMPDQIVATDLRDQGYESFIITYAQGRGIKAGDEKKAVVGSDLVKKLNAKVGENINLKNEQFEVIGIMEKTLTAPDNTVEIPLADIQRLYYKTLPEVVQKGIQENQLASSIIVYPQDGVDPEKLAEKIKADIPNVEAMSPQKFEQQVVSSVSIFSSIIYAIALISLLVGGLSIINTMSMAIAERTKEIGIRKAIGASDGAILRQFLAESGMIGFIGGVFGIGFGSFFTLLANLAGNDSGTKLFLLTPRLLLGTLAFAIILGILSGLYPASKAAKLNPVEALRFE